MPGKVWHTCMVEASRIPAKGGNPRGLRDWPPHVASLRAEAWWRRGESNPCPKCYAAGFYMVRSPY